MSIFKGAGIAIKNFRFDQNRHRNFKAILHSGYAGIRDKQQESAT
jgi:hypothetical protein